MHLREREKEREAREGKESKKNREKNHCTYTQSHDGRDPSYIKVIMIELVSSCLFFPSQYIYLEKVF